MKYTEVVFNNVNPEQSEILVALLANEGFEGFEENDGMLKAFIKEDDFNKTEFEKITAGAGHTFKLSLIEQQNWNAQWESSFDPVIVNEFAAVRASFHKPVTGVKHEIIITPKMSFGTGHHATTYLMMQQMSHIDFTGKTVFDFGTGTGVLAILAEKMGAVKIDAIDNDEWSVENTKENIAANNCYSVNVEMASSIKSTNKYDIVLANINLNVLLASMQHITAICKNETIVLFSGIFQDDAATLKEAAAKNGLFFKNIAEKNNWLCILATA